VLISAVGTDPSGGGLVLLGWLLLWPAVAVAVVYIPVRAISVHSTLAHVAVSVGLGVVAVAGALLAQQRDPSDVWASRARLTRHSRAALERVTS